MHEYLDRLPIFVTKLGHYPIISGIPWVKQQDITMRFTSNLITFGSQYSLAQYNDRAVIVHGTSKNPPELLSTNAASLSIAMIGPIPLNY
jgi:hypothetical protein